MTIAFEYISMSFQTLLPGIIFILSVIYFGKLIWEFSGSTTSNIRPEKYTGNPFQYIFSSYLKTSPEKKKSTGENFTPNSSGYFEPTYHDFTNRLPGVVFECDETGNIGYLNDAAFRMLDVVKEDLEEGIVIFDFFHPDDLEKLRDRMRTDTKDYESNDNEFRIISRKGKEYFVLAFILPFFHNGQFVNYSGLLVDISQRKRNEDTMRVLEDIISHMDLGLNVFYHEKSESLSSFRLEMVNKASEKLLRFSVSRNVGKTLDEISPMLRQYQLHNIFFNVVSTQSPSEVEDFVYNPDNSASPYIYNLKIFPLPKERVAMLIEDVTEKKKTEATLRMTSFGIENAGDIILWIDENARFTFANETACKRYGYARQDLMKLGISDVDTRITTMQWYELTQIMESKQTITMESINKMHDGRTFPVEIVINRVIYDGKKQYFAFVRDISERNRNIELEQKIQIARKSAALKQQFLANMSHEIRTPMTGIMGMTSLLMKSNLSIAQQEYVRNIKISSENLLNIINDVLDLSKIEAGKLELKPTLVDLPEFVNQIKEMFLHTAKSKEIEFKTFIDPLLPKTIIVDENRLKQLANNLLSNAFKFTDEGEIFTGFYMKEKRQDHLLISCDVADTGMGISEKNQKQIFEKFTQIDTSLIRPFEGTGLGLAICRELSHLMGGDISVKSELGEGSTFTFTFKAEFEEEDLSGPIEVSPGELKDLNMNVLHVEDKLLNQKVVGFILFGAGCNVDFLSNGQEAVDEYIPGKYDIILMDIQMPVMDGITAYKELKRLHGDKLCPVIGLSANAMEGDAEKFMELGLDDYIAKPFKPKELYDKLIQWSGKIYDGKK
ncbi:MAG: PAS domain S-box protein [Bacteroidetes bacterium]|nr:MAG: PAS domain S-box protein [Bacteroidota bacterium]